MAETHRDEQRALREHAGRDKRERDTDEEVAIAFSGTQVYGANGKVFGVERAEPVITGIWVRPRDVKTGERLAVEHDEADGLWRLVYETVLPERVHLVDAHQRKVHCEIMITDAELYWMREIGLAHERLSIEARRRLPVPPALEVDDLLDLAARAASAWHAPAGQEVELTPAELHQLGEGAAMEIDRLQRAEHAAVQEVRRLSREIQTLEVQHERDTAAVLRAEHELRALKAQVVSAMSTAGPSVTGPYEIPDDELAWFIAQAREEQASTGILHPLAALANLASDVAATAKRIRGTTRATVDASALSALTAVVRPTGDDDDTVVVDVSR